MTTLAITFTNFGPYHLARLRALAEALNANAGRLIAYEVAGAEHRYPWQTSRADEPFDWRTLFPGRALETLPRARCASAMRQALEQDGPDAVAIVGYARPESMAALHWARKSSRPVILMSETQEIDHPRVWWKESIKRRRIRLCSSALVGGPRHRDYLVKLGIPAGQIVLGYNAVDNAWYDHHAALARRHSGDRHGLPQRPYFLAVSRFVPEKNLVRLVKAFARCRQSAHEPWDLALCGDGPEARTIEAAIASPGLSCAIHRPGFLQADDLVRWYAFASAFVHPSLMEPWGLVANEAAACGLPLLVSERAGCCETLVPDPPGTTGRRFDPHDEAGLAAALGWMASLTETERVAMGQRAAEVVLQWGPERFAAGTLEALAIAERVPATRRSRSRQLQEALR